MKRRFLVSCALALGLGITLSGCTSDQMKANAGNAAGVLGGLLTKSPGGAVSSGVNLINDNLLGGNRYVKTIGKIVGTGVDAGTGNWAGAATSGGSLLYNGIKSAGNRKNQTEPAPRQADPAPRTEPDRDILPADQE